MRLQRQLDSDPGDDDVRFSAFRLKRDGVLHCPDESRVQLSGRLACVLFELAREKGMIVSRQQLIESCWPGTPVGEENLSRAISDLRKVMRKHGGDCIETVYGFGYRLSTGASDPALQESLSFCQEAWHRVYQRRLATLESAEHLFSEAISRRSDHIPSWLGLAETEFHKMQLGYVTTLESAPKAHRALDQALTLDPECSDALALKGLLLTWAERDFDAAQTLLERSRESEAGAYRPNQATGLHALALGQLEAANHHFELACAENPVSMTARAGRAFARMYQGDHETALRLAREMRETDPHGAVSLGLAAIFEAALGAPGEAVAMASRCFEALPESAASGAILAYSMARDGRRETAKELLDSTTTGGFLVGSNTLAALAWQELDDHDAALATLTSGFEGRCPWFLQMLWDPRLEGLDLEPLRAAAFRKAKRSQAV